MTEHEMIFLLERCLLDAKTCEVDIWWANMYFDAGEWLLALVELEQIKDAQYVSGHIDDFNKIRDFMGDPKDPYV